MSPNTGRKRTKNPVVLRDSILFSAPLIQSGLVDGGFCRASRKDCDTQSRGNKKGEEGTHIPTLEIEFTITLARPRQPHPPSLQ